ncbi:MAG: 4Fe-4S binding protein [Nitrospiraceae bacterium]
MAAEQEYSRRRFFRDSVNSIARAATEFHKHSQAAPAEQATAAPIIRTDFLRPPGAVEEAAFLERCTRCDDCVAACPHGSIVRSEADASPVIFADEMPCYLCHDLPCIAACGTDALVMVESPQLVRMGQAVVSDRFCTASHGCHACVSKCPVEALHMDFGDMKLRVDAATCVGCGVCEYVCGSVNDRIAIRVHASGR